MKVLHVITELDKMYGAQRHVVECIKNHVHNHHECLVITGKTGTATTEINLLGVSTILVPSLKNVNYSFFSDIKAILKVAKTIQSFNPDLVISHSTKAGIVTRIACYIKKTPNIFTVHGWSFEIGAPWHQRIMGRIIELLIKSLSDSYHCVSHYTAEYGKRILHLQQEKVYVCPNMHMQKADTGINPTLYKNILMVAGFRKQKDHFTALRALEYILRTKRNDLHFTFVGDGPKRKEITKFIYNHHLESHITIAGETMDIDAYYQTCDIVILPTYYEGLPLSLIEAIQSKKAVIGTNVGGVNEIIHDNVNGNLITVEDHITLGNLIVAYYENNKVIELAANSFNIYNELYSYEKVSHRFNLMLQEAIQNSAYRKKEKTHKE